ncbi:hypothetical protein V8G54_022277 [Vigna mungo]|uniref:Uncharacterized protein n=1 Tax=Vigna mungo TaxID=3915 RepID=A0AAQ3NH86_VIGMU
MIRGPRGIEGRNWAMRKPRVMVVRRCNLDLMQARGLSFCTHAEDPPTQHEFSETACYLYKLIPRISSHAVSFDSPLFVTPSSQKKKIIYTVAVSMENAISSSLARTKSEDVEETVTTTSVKSPPSAEDGGVLSRKSSKTAASPSGGGGRSTHIRRARSAQLKVDVDEVGSGVALSRASSASLGLSFSFTGFTLPPDEIADSKPFSDEDIPEDIEAGTHKPKFQTEHTLPIYLKATVKLHLAINATNRTCYMAINIAWSGSVLYKVSFQVMPMYKTTPSF